MNTGEYLGSLVRIIPTAGHDLYVVRMGKGRFLSQPSTRWSGRLTLKKGI